MLQAFLSIVSIGWFVAETYRRGEVRLGVDAEFEGLPTPQAHHLRRTEPYGQQWS